MLHDGFKSLIRALRSDKRNYLPVHTPPLYWEPHWMLQHLFLASLLYIFSVERTKTQNDQASRRLGMYPLIQASFSTVIQDNIKSFRLAQSPCQKISRFSLGFPSLPSKSRPVWAASRDTMLLQPEVTATSYAVCPVAFLRLTPALQLKHKHRCFLFFRILFFDVIGA